MKRQTRIIVISGIFGMIAWVVDAVFDHFIFYAKPFWDLLIFHVPFHEVYVRSAILGCFLVFGAIASRLVAAQERAERELQHAHDHLKEMVEQRTESLRKTCETLKAEIEERKLLETEERYHMLFDKANDSIFVAELTAEQQPGSRNPRHRIMADTLKFLQEKRGRNWCLRPFRFHCCNA